MKELKAITHGAIYVVIIEDAYCGGNTRSLIVRDGDFEISYPFILMNESYSLEGYKKLSENVGHTVYCKRE